MLIWIQDEMRGTTGINPGWMGYTSLHTFEEGDDLYKI